MSDVLELFPERVIPEPNSGCWLWTENWNDAGYGTVYVSAARRQIMAHRHSYEISVGPIPEGLEIDHLCRQRCCVNPQHLEPVTTRENVLRMARALERERNFHCRNGHKRTEENTFVKPNGARVCNECRRGCRRRWAGTSKGAGWKRGLRPWQPGHPNYVSPSERERASGRPIPDAALK